MKPTITDICLVTRDIDAAISFYTDKLDFVLESRMPGFADFSGPGVLLALWDAAKIRETTPVPAQNSEPDGRGVMIAVELDRPEEIDAAYERLAAKGLEFYAPPGDYPWNARCLYFPGPCGEFWEFFAWYDGGKPGTVNSLSETDS